MYSIESETGCTTVQNRNGLYELPLEEPGNYELPLDPSSDNAGIQEINYCNNTLTRDRCGEKKHSIESETGCTTVQNRNGLYELPLEEQPDIYELPLDPSSDNAGIKEINYRNNTLTRDRGGEKMYSIESETPYITIQNRNGLYELPLEEPGNYELPLDPSSDNAGIQEINYCNNILTRDRCGEKKHSIESETGCTTVQNRNGVYELPLEEQPDIYELPLDPSSDNAGIQEINYRNNTLTRDRGGEKMYSIESETPYIAIQNRNGVYELPLEEPGNYELPLDPSSDNAGIQEINYCNNTLTRDRCGEKKHSIESETGCTTVQNRN
eukprot:UC4_evm1s1578